MQLLPLRTTVLVALAAAMVGACGGDVSWAICSGDGQQTNVAVGFNGGHCEERPKLTQTEPAPAS